MKRQVLLAITHMVYIFPTLSANETFKKGYMWWSHLLLVLFFRFLTYCFQNVG